MSDYIKREDAKRAIRRNFHDFGTRCMINNIINEVAKVSSNNLVEVVRCKDCKHFDTGYCGIPFIGKKVSPNHYCSFGERAES